MEAPITMGINHRPAPEPLVPYWIDGLGSWWESALCSEAKRAALAYCGALTEGNRLSFQDIYDYVAKNFLNAGEGFWASAATINGEGIGNVVPN
jgi:hypothetical protein